MSHSIEISDDDESFEAFAAESSTPILRSLLSNNEKENDVKKTIYEISSDEEDLPSVCINRKALIKNLFPVFKSQNQIQHIYKPPEEVLTTVQKPTELKSFEKMIGGVKVLLPVDPYGCQVALMFKVITAINKGQNCLLESPTGSGKTLALLCAALAWQKQEQDRLSEENAKQYFSVHPELNQLPRAQEYIASPVSSSSTVIPDSPEKFFSRPVHGEKSIYDNAAQDLPDASLIIKRQEPLYDSPEGQPCDGLVKIHKRRRLNSSDVCDDAETTSAKLPTTPEKNISVQAPSPETPQHVRLPTIYYGARTHKQLQQVIKEFKRTAYCGQALMTILSSRDNSCIREYDRSQWSSKNDMCRGCIKKLSRSESSKNDGSNCKFYDNRQALTHIVLPPAFDLRDLVAAGEEIMACPYYAARDMASKANIVFCPYNYLIEPGIRSSMQIDLNNNIVIIDEGHNIEDICRDAATFTITREQVIAALTQLEAASSYQYATQDGNCVDSLIKALRNWDQWFVNQVPLVNKQAVNDSEALYVWDVQHFAQSLHNHNIGMEQYLAFRQNAEVFCRRLREDPRTMVNVTQPTSTLIESIDTVLGYLFRDSGKFMDDFKPILVRNVAGAEYQGATSWRSSQFNKSVAKESLSLRLICMNSAVVFDALKTARSILLASGTLTPQVSLHSELATDFPLQISTNHVIPSERVWVGTLHTDEAGERLECSSKFTANAHVQDALGRALLRVARVTPHGVLAFLPSYSLMNKLVARWQEISIWQELAELKHIFMESRNVRDHDDVMEDYYKYAETDKGAMLIAVYRGKVSEGMDFRDHQARAVVAVGIPYPNTFDVAVKEKMKYNDKYAVERRLLPGREWLRVQAYRALNQALGRCVRHRGDWGAVLLLDARYSAPYYTQHLSKWVRNYLGSNHHTYDSLVNSPNSLESFMKNMTVKESEHL